jgi:hypothetical protein
MRRLEFCHGIHQNHSKHQEKELDKLVLGDYELLQNDLNNGNVDKDANWNGHYYS